MSVLHIRESDLSFDVEASSRTRCGKTVWANDACTLPALRAKIRPRTIDSVGREAEVLCEECKAAVVDSELTEPRLLGVDT